MGEAKFIDSMFCQTMFDLKDSDIDLVSILELDENGKRWLENHRKYFAEVYHKSVPMNFSIRLLTMPPLEYCLSPDDYLERIDKCRHYNPPTGIIDCLPKSAVYANFAAQKPALKNSGLTPA